MEHLFEPLCMGLVVLLAFGVPFFLFNYVLHGSPLPKDMLGR